jgi:hypothetical protein
MLLSVLLRSCLCLLGGTVVYHDATMKFHFFHFFPKTGYFQYIMRHAIEIFEKYKYFLFEI